MVPRGASSTGRTDATDRRADGLCRERLGSTGLGRSISGGTPKARVDRGPQHTNRHSLGPGRHGSDATVRAGVGRAEARSHSFANPPTTAALLQQTRTIPIVFAMVADPVGSGFVANMSRPGGQVTGFATMEGSLGGKWLELLKEVAPRVARVAVLFNPTTAATFAEYYLNPMKAASASFGVEVIAAPVHDTTELESVVARQAREPNGGLIVLPEAFLIGHRAEVTSLAARYSLPAVYPYRQFPEIGGLLSYGFDRLDNWRRAASYVDRILKGEKPGDLPVQTPTKYELVINLKTAKSLGLTISRELQLRADDVIE
jgi:ABC-type uncharacterized transport system substrate-binding protein